MTACPSPLFRVKLVAMTLGLVLAAQLGFFTAGAQATAFGQQPFAAMTLPNSWHVPSGLYEVTLYGQGTYVRSVSARFSVAKPGGICHTTMTAEFFDANWRWLYTRESSKKAKCTWKRSVSLRIRRNEQPGFMCSSLRSGGQRVTSVCHAITP